MSISMKKCYKTRDGRSVRVLAVDVKGTYPVVAAVVWKSGNEDIHYYTQGGAVDTRDTNHLDLVEVKEKVVFWFNSYKAREQNRPGAMYMHDSEEKALEMVSDIGGLVIKARRIELEVD